MLTLYSYFVIEDKKIDPSAYVVLEEVIKDLEDKDVNVPFKKESIIALFIQDSKELYDILDELRESEYYNELEGLLHENYRTLILEEFYCINYDPKYKEEPYNFFGKICEYYYGNLTFVSEILCSNIEMSRKVNILYDILKDYLEKSYGISNFACTLNPKGAVIDLSRTNYEVREQKINELCEAFRIEIEKNKEKKEELLDIILRISRDRAVDWICYLQEKKLVDFMSEKRKINTMHFDIIEASLCVILGVNKLGNIMKIYQLEDYNKLPENIRANDDDYILSNIRVDDIAPFIALPNYKTSIADIELMGKRLLRDQILGSKMEVELIEQIKSAIIHKAKDKEEYKTYCELAKMFEQLADYKSYKEQREKERIERERLKEQEERQLLNARYEVILRLYNMSESLQEQVPNKRFIKELVFQKENQDD